MDVREGLRRARQVLGVVSSPELRGLLNGDRTGDGDGDALDPRTSAALRRLDWLAADGAVDVPLLRRTTAVLEELLTDRAVLRVDRVRDLPADEERRRSLSVEVVRIAFDRLGPRRTVSEEVLNAALAVLVEDVATVRRDAVDAGLLRRTADGRRYALDATGRAARDA